MSYENESNMSDMDFARSFTLQMKILCNLLVFKECVGYDSQQLPYQILTYNLSK